MQKQVDVALVSMPWGPPTEPSLGLSILKACLNQQNIASKVFHMAPEMLRWCTIETYAFLADRWGFNDFLFAGVIDPVVDEAQQHVLCEQVANYAAAKIHSRYTDVTSILDLTWKMREHIVPAFIDSTVERILSCRPKMIGLTCLFDQTIPSIALAKRLKEVATNIPIVLGGYALEGPPSLTIEKAFPWIDLIVAGDGEQSIVDLAQDVLAGKDISFRANTSAKVMRTIPVNLEDSPLPDYDDWFIDVEQLATTDKIKISTETLPVEGSRGCWWGQSQHCIFCGIDEDTLKYRRKSASKTLSMLAAMRKRYGHYTFRFSDYIMPKDFYTNLLPTLAKEKPKYRLHSEVKANHPPERVKLLSDAGFREIQPGIESFSTPVLREMHKGVTSILNVSLLKSGYLYEITVHYNLLFGLPGDTSPVYLDMLRHVPFLYHLIPPVTCTDTAITRFAPLHSDPLRFGIQKPNVHHHCYDMLFSSEYLRHTGFSYDSYAYFFERNFEYVDNLEILYRQLCQQVEHWKSLHRERFVELSFTIINDKISIIDSRYQEQPLQYFLSAEASAVYLQCDTRPIKVNKIKPQLESIGCGLTEQALMNAVDELIKHRLIWREDDLILGLAIPNEISVRYQASGWCKTWDSLIE